MANDRPNEVPSGGILIPTLGVGGHCLPKDGILLWWRKLETSNKTPDSLILESRKINNESPTLTFSQAEKVFGNIRDKKIALLGVAYRFNSEDTRNSPTLELANYLRDQKIDYLMHDPYVKSDDQNLLIYNQQDKLSHDLTNAIQNAEIVIMCTAHKEYLDKIEQISSGPGLTAVMDACNIYKRAYFQNKGLKYSGIGRGTEEPTNDFVDFVYNSFQVMERGLANELNALIEFYNENYAHDEFNKVKFAEVQKLAKTCSTGCEIANPGAIENLPTYKNFTPKLSQIAFELSQSGK